MRNRILGVLFSGLRVWLGVQWLDAGLHKVGNAAWTGENAGTAVTGYLRGAIAKASGENPVVASWYANFLESFALHQAKLFSWLVAWGELLVGIALIAGVFIVFSASMGALMNLNFMLAGTLSSNPILYTASVIVLLGLKHARFLSVDRLREKFFPTIDFKAYLKNHLRFRLSS